MTHVLCNLMSSYLSATLTMCDIVQCAMRPRRTRRCTFVCRPRRTRWPPGTARIATTRSESRFGTSLGQLLPPPVRRRD
ncbi:hypothetical protein Y032_0093g2676 [Ancylostoma ceylanicum]|uniref:Secreted protein n=1 Tax=Ancylostoma ceylanicum TaxID=53326 RepID=A0A016TKW0_9BILA|nr:hypothetical protein Y032_0093g2676 [Ancylostoma ceylanicum]